MEAVEYDLGRSSAEGWFEPDYHLMRSGNIRTGAKRTIPYKLCSYAKRTGDTKQDGVKLHLS